MWIFVRIRCWYKAKIKKRQEIIENDRKIKKYFDIKSNEEKRALNLNQTERIT